ncbi:DNA-binding response regulator [Lachnoclostridium sp. An169]|uniref:LytR/AlgR family response regulator transcription factor n=1 Tax=Lachnoclostridium sp. An169 TaxID=1965569 RepID=UPI000B387CDE|nr:LytTR family DNA-binding domain-containing protein [Lachnoclostridium sp. An169]OUP84146.1 DNA-binding response regulator [Lachnoclostridium sp. An169]
MIKTAVCDDEKGAALACEKIARETLQKCGCSFEITIYTQSRNLLSDIADDGYFYDLLLLDIEMPELSGMEMAEKIRRYLPNVRIIFTTSHLEYAIDAFELSIFRYVPKNELETRLAPAVAEAARLISLESGKEYLIQTGNRMERIPYRDICYIVRDGKNSCFITERGVSKVRKSLQKVYEELDNTEFIFIDRGCIVNLIHVMRISGGMAVLKNGEELPISRSHVQEVREQINRFWGSRI